MEKIYFIIQIKMQRLWIILCVILWVIIWNFIYDALVGYLTIHYFWEEKEESDLPENNLVEFVGEDENGNWIYKLK